MKNKGIMKKRKGRKEEEEGWVLGRKYRRMGSERSEWRSEEN